MLSSNARALRVARIITRLNVGGPTRQAIDLTRRFARPPGSAILVAGRVGRDDGDRTNEAAPLGASFLMIEGLGRGRGPVALARAAAALSRSIRAFRPHVVHTHESRAGFLGRRAARAERVPVIVHTHHGHVLQRYFGPIRSTAFLMAERWLAGFSDALVVPAPEIADELAALGVAPRSKFVVVDPGLDVEGLLAGPIAPDPAARKRLSLPATRPVVAFAGRLVPIKDPLLFVSAARRIAAAVPEALFVVAGDGPLRRPAESAAAAAAPGRFRFVGFLGDAAGDLLAAADLVVLSSRHEGLPAVLVEAMACGAAVVATRVGGVPGLVEDGVTGRLVPAGDAEALAAAAIGLLRDGAFRASIGAAAREAIRERRFSPERMARELSLLYERLLGAKGIDASAERPA